MILEIASDMARILFEARAQRASKLNLAAISDSFDYPLEDLNQITIQDCEKTPIIQNLSKEIGNGYFRH